MEKTKTYYFKTEKELLSHLEKLRNSNTEIIDVYSPYPVHNVSYFLPKRKTNIPLVGLVGGIIGAFLGIWLQIWVSTSAYPLNFGGKPFLAYPSFIPVVFECMVLLASISMVAAYFIRNRLGVVSPNQVIHADVSDDTFVVIVRANSKKQLIDKQTSEFHQVNLLMLIGKRLKV